jgi:hypothetical protein
MSDSRSSNVFKFRVRSRSHPPQKWFAGERHSGMTMAWSHKKVDYRNIILKKEVSEERRSATIEADQRRTLTAHDTNSGRQQLPQEIAGRRACKHEFTLTMFTAIRDPRESSSIEDKVGGTSHSEAFYVLSNAFQSAVLTGPNGGS